MRIGFLWASEDSGFYALSPFDDLYRNVGHNNGNLVFVHAIDTQIAGTKIFMPWHTRPEIINRDCDIVVIPSANQLGKHTDLGNLADSLEQVEVPVVSIGLGAQANDFSAEVTLTPGTRRWLDVLLANGKRHGIRNIYTRGPYTSDQIRAITGEETIAGGCPSHFINGRPDLGQAIARNWTAHDLPRSIAVAGGHQSWKAVRGIEQQLIGLMMDPVYPGIYIPQSMGDMIKISRGLFDEIAPDVLDRIRRHVTPHYSMDLFKAWADRFARTFYDVPAWADELRRFDLVMGPRYHGCALAIQTERMACTVTIDSRTEEMCRETGVPHVRAADLSGPITRERLRHEIITFDPEAYDAHRQQKCAAYVRFLEGCGLVPAEHLRRIAAAG